MRTVFWVIAFLLGALHAWAYRHTMNPDGVCYLDIADAYLRGDWPNAINAYWSPLYSWFLGLAIVVIKPSPYWEFSVAHLANFFLYLGALACFEIFLRELIHHHRNDEIRFSQERLIRLPKWAMSSLGYSLFIWSSLELITMRVVAPDLLAAALVFLAASFLLKIQRAFTRSIYFVLLGMILGLGYLARAFMFPLAFVFLGAALIAVGNLRKGFPGVLSALIVFLIVIAPFIAAISKTKGRLTFGDQTRVKFFAYSDESGVPSHHRLQTFQFGVPEHPTREIFDRPAIYEFATPIGGTYPFHYDEPYWIEGLRPRLDWTKQFKLSRSGIKIYGVILFRLLSGFTVALFVLLYMGSRHWMGVKEMLRQRPFLIPALAALVMFLPFQVENRVTAPFVVLLGMGLLSGIRLPDSQESKRLITGATVAVLIVTAIQLSVLMDREIYVQARDLVKRASSTPHVHWQIAEDLHHIGIRPGDKVASVGPSYGHYWARLARVRIVAEMPSSEEVKYFWSLDPESQSQIIKAFEKTGARAIIAEVVPGFILPADWKQIGNTNYFAYLLPAH